MGYTTRVQKEVNNNIVKNRNKRKFRKPRSYDNRAAESRTEYNAEFVSTLSTDFLPKHLYNPDMDYMWVNIDPNMGDVETAHAHQRGFQLVNRSDDHFCPDPLNEYKQSEHYYINKGRVLMHRPIEYKKREEDQAQAKYRQSVGADDIVGNNKDISIEIKKSFG